MKKLVISATAVILAACILLFAACNKKENKTDSPEGPLTDLVTKLYETSTLDDETKGYLAGYETTEITADISANFLPADLKYDEAVVSAPRMSSTAYELILIRFPDGTDMEAAKKTIKDNANPVKWVCVEADQIVVENNGNVVMFAMISSELLDAEALRTSFAAL